MINKNYFIFAAAIALASCSVDEYVGENPEFTQTTKENIIGFGGGTGSMSRTTSNTGTTEEMLDKQFKVYGWKTVKGDPSTQLVFNNYWVWYSETATPSNPDAALSASKKSWEYVGNSGTQMPFKDTDGSNKTLGNTQTIKYWDYSATDYRFVAGSPISAFTFNPESTGQIPIATATVTGLGGHITPNTGEESTAIQPDPVYIAQPKVITPNNYKNAVELQFTRLQTKVRVGIYETIPGYSITSIEFYSQDGIKTENNVTLYSEKENYFTGGSKVEATVNYTWGNTPTYTLEYSQAGGATETGAFVQLKNWYGGKFANGIPAQSSIPSGENKIEKLYGKDTDMDGETGYFTVLPTETGTDPSALTIKCDFTLESDDNSGEKIYVKGATAAIPAEYCKWGDNKMYTYIFKISQETNGHTGDENHPGLFPITFDAAAVATDQGTETIVQAPSITTHQAGSVTNNGIEYKTGEKIEITVMKDGVLQTLNNSSTPSISEGYIAVYKLTGEKTEAQLTVTAPTETAVSSLNVETNKATFTPDTDAYYAIQYCYSVTTEGKPVYKYKVIKVENQSSGN